MSDKYLFDTAVTLRAELKAAHEERDMLECHRSNIAKDVIGLRTELDRMRQALEGIQGVLCDSTGQFKTEVDRTVTISQIVDRALNPQPAYRAPETTWTPMVDVPGYEQRVNENGHLETRPQPSQPETK